MAEQYLGVDFDIHGGGIDLVFPHHENEAAQTLAGRGKPLARVWMHNGMLQLGDEKMSKSVGNIRVSATRSTQVGRDALVMYFSAATTGSRSRSRTSAWRTRERAAARIREAARRVHAGELAGGPGPARDAFFDALADDFNTPQALAALYEWVNEANRREAPGRRRATCARCSSVLGLDNLLDAAADGPPPRPSSWPSGAQAARARRTSPRPTACATSSRAAGWEVRDGPEGPELVQTG